MMLLGCMVCDSRRNLGGDDDEDAILNLCRLNAKETMCDRCDGVVGRTAGGLLGG